MTLSHFPQTRLRRLRRTPGIRQLIQETQLNLKKLIFPLFIKHGSNVKHPIPSMPGHYQISLDRLEEEIHALANIDIKNIILFGIPAHKNSLGESAYSPDGIIQSAIALIKKIAPQFLVISDVCLCEYTDHGHCGFATPTQEIDNDKTLDLLAKQAVSHAAAGADIVAPSANMDGMVLAIRNKLDASGFAEIPILSYSVKYASALYGPFRQAAEGAPQWGDRRTYQMDIANAREAIRECALDIHEGADMLMVKPAHTYLDVISRVRQTYPDLPLCAYHTSGEFAMLKAAIERGWLEEHRTVSEVLTSIFRAGADFIITYYAKELATWACAPK